MYKYKLIDLKQEELKACELSNKPNHKQYSQIYLSLHLNK